MAHGTSRAVVSVRVGQAVVGACQRGTRGTCPDRSECKQRVDAGECRRLQEASAPAVLMKNDPIHNATRGVFSRVRSEIAARQNVSPRDLDWSKISCGTAWLLAEEQFEAALIPANVRAEYLRQVNEYID